MGAVIGGGRHKDGAARDDVGDKNWTNYMELLITDLLIEWLTIRNMDGSTVHFPARAPKNVRG